MSISHYAILTGFFFLFLYCIYNFFRIIITGIPNDYSQPIGRIGPAIIYSFTGAMSPKKKESAYLHFPTYIAGIIFHLGTFIVFILLILFFFSIEIKSWIILSVGISLSLSSICGLAVLVKRVFNAKLRNLSKPDDYVSNLLVTGLHILTAITLFQISLLPYLFFYSALLLLYIPISKLRHSIYFVTSRIHLGIFFGSRGVWSSKKTYDKI